MCLSNRYTSVWRLHTAPLHVEAIVRRIQYIVSRTFVRTVHLEEVAVIRERISKPVELSDLIFSRDLVWTVVGAVLGFVLSETVRGLRSWRQKRRTARRLQLDEAKRTQAFQRVQSYSETSLSILTLSTDSTPFERRNVSVREHDNPFYLSVPQPYIGQLQESTPDFHRSFSVHEQQVFGASDSLEPLVQWTGIEDLDVLIDDCRRDVAVSFLRRADGNHFNQDKYGVWSIDPMRRYGPDEARGLHVTVFRTDYFTHKTMTAVYHRLLERGSPFCRIDRESVLGSPHRFRPFLTSLGVNAYVLLDGLTDASASGDSSTWDPLQYLVFAKRSALASRSSFSGMYHVSMNEGFSDTDRDPIQQKPDLYACLDRGLSEELGLPPSVISDSVEKRFFDVFLGLDNLEIGISCTVRIPRLSFERLKRYAHVARDHGLEIAEVTCVPFREAELTQFLETSELTPPAKYILLRLATIDGMFLSTDSLPSTQ